MINAPIGACSRSSIPFRSHMSPDLTLLLTVMKPLTAAHPTYKIGSKRHHCSVQSHSLNQGTRGTERVVHKEAAGIALS